jgi:formylglycine-generating enzyme required for sulfatase activity
VPDTGAVGRGPNFPVCYVSWYDAVLFCNQKSKRDSLDTVYGYISLSRLVNGSVYGITGLTINYSRNGYRLPTEAEWEFAARGGFPQRIYLWGDTLPAIQPDRWRDGPEPVGQGEPNGYGLFDMCQNVHEWCSDWYDPAYYAVADAMNPQGPSRGVRRASKGGAWRHQIKFSRCAARSSIPPELRYADYGFRPVVSSF